MLLGNRGISPFRIFYILKLTPGNQEGDREGGGKQGKKGILGSRQSFRSDLSWFSWRDAGVGRNVGRKK